MFYFRCRACGHYTTRKSNRASQRCARGNPTCRGPLRYLGSQMDALEFVARLMFTTKPRERTTR